MKIFLGFITFFILTSQSHALVNMRNGSYTEKWIDFIEPQVGIDMRVERFYSSRSLFIGLFGFGWCSSLETHLTITSDGILNLTECGGGLEVTYYPKDFDIKSPTATIEAIIADYKRKNKLQSKDLENLRTQLKFNTKMRFEYANKLALVDIKKIKSKKNVFLSKSKGFEKIIFNGRYYERTKFDGSSERFNLKGQLIRRTNKAGLFIKINYKGPRIAHIADNKGRRLTFNYDRNGILSRIGNGQGLEVTYKFEGENLVQVKNMWSKTYTYDYDASHNMVGVQFPDKTKMRMSYNLAKDWIKTYHTRNNCKETYNFILSQDDPQNHYSGQFTRQCPKGPQHLGAHEFWYRNYGFSKGKYLHRVKESYRKDFKDVVFHPYLGRPVSIEENSLKSFFSYYINGLVNKREQKFISPKNEIIDWNNISFKYNFKKLQVTETVQSNLSKVGKLLNKVVIQYTYNKQGLLSKASQKKGPAVSLVYDKNGKLDRMMDHRKNRLQITYQVGVEKPIEIEQNGLGKIFISYNPSGEVESIKSSGKRNIASSVVEQFIKMTSYLGPMGEDLKL